MNQEVAVEMGEPLKFKGNKDDYDFEVPEVEENYYRFEDADLRILKGLVSNSSTCLDFAGHHDSTLFIASGQELAEVILTYASNYKSSPTLRVLEEEYSDNPKKLELIRTGFQQMDLFEHDPKEFSYDLQKLKDRYVDWKVKSIEEKIGTSLPSQEKIRQLKSLVYEIERPLGSHKEIVTRKTLKEGIPEFKEQLKIKAKNPELGRGILSGYSHFDFLKNGMLGGEVLIVAGESNSGKSLVLNNMGLQMWMQGNQFTTPKSSYQKGYNIMFFSLEMTYEACFRRTLSRLSQVPYFNLRDAKLNQYQVDQLNKASHFIRDYPYDFTIIELPRGLTMEDIEEIYENTPNKPDCIVIDYLTLMDIPGFGGEDWEKLDKLTERIHELAKRLRIPIISAVQLNAPTKTPKNPMENIGPHRIARSRGITNNVDIILQIEQRMDETSYPDMPVHIIKGRDIPKGVKFNLVKKFQTMSVFDQDEPFKPDENHNPDVNPDDISEQLREINWLD